MVPYNVTPGSQKAFKKAVALSETLQTKVTILTCLEECTTFGFFKTYESVENEERKYIQFIKYKKKTNKFRDEYRGGN